MRFITTSTLGRALAVMVVFGDQTFTAGVNARVHLCGCRHFCGTYFTSGGLYTPDSTCCKCAATHMQWCEICRH